MTTLGGSRWTDSEVLASLATRDTGISVDGGEASLTILNTAEEPERRGGPGIITSRIARKKRSGAFVTAWPLANYVCARCFDCVWCLRFGVPLATCLEYFVRPQTDRKIKVFFGYLRNVEGTGEKKVLPTLGRSDRAIEVSVDLRDLKGTGEEKVVTTSGRSQWTDSEVQALPVARHFGISVDGGEASLGILNAAEGLRSRTSRHHYLLNCSEEFRRFRYGVAAAELCVRKLL